MPSKTKEARMGAKGAVAVVRHPIFRRAAPRSAKLGWRIGMVAAKRKARPQMERLGAAGRTAASLAVIYGPMAAEVFGLVEVPKPKRRSPAFVAGVVIGGGAAYALSRKTSGD
jgi:hypothetical protein